MEEYIRVNSTISKVDDSFLEKFDSISRGEFFDCIDRIYLINKLISTDRKYASDLERWDNPNLPDIENNKNGNYRKRDPNGRIYVDLTNPHILTDMDYFRQAAIHFEKHGVYTFYPKSKNPNSDYRKFWDEERRRCIEGYVRESDGEWIPGYYYDFLNYGRVEIAYTDKSGRGYKKEGFPKVYDSHYWLFHYIEQCETEGLFGFGLKKRRWGYSFCAGSMCKRNYVHIKHSKSYILADGKEFLEKDGTLHKFKDQLNFVETNTPFWSPRTKDIIEHTRSGYIDPEKHIERGRLSEVMAVTCKGDPSKGRGKSGKLLLFEETGNFVNLSKVWTIAEESVRQDDIYYGFLIGFGTGGEEGSNFDSAEKMFYDPEAFHIKSIRNIYSKTNGNGECAFFAPSYISYEGMYDNNGNSDVLGALKSILLERQKIRLKSKDNNRLVQKKAEKPIIPEEAVLRTEGSIFPVNDIKDRLSYIQPILSTYVKGHLCGRLSLNEKNEPVFISENKNPIRKYPLVNGNDTLGCLEIFELPRKNSSNNIADNRYILGADPFDDDEVKWSDSLGSIFCFDLFTDRIVAEYTGRPKTANEFYEICYRLTKFYNGILMYENNKKGLFSYFSQHHALHLLADNPSLLNDKENIYISKYSFNNTKKGFTATPRINSYARRLQADWMTDINKSMTEYDENGNIVKVVTNLQTIRSIGYLEEAARWNSDINCDRISAMNGIFILREQLGKFFNEKNESKKMSDIITDPFIKKHFGYVKHNVDMLYNSEKKGNII